MRRGRFVAILQPWDGVPAGGAAGGQRCAGLTEWKEEGVYRIWKSRRIRQHIYGVKVGILKKAYGS